MKKENRFLTQKFAKQAALTFGLLVAGTAVAMASTAGGPFSAIETFINNNFLPGVGTIGIAGGIGYAAIHGFKHDYGKMTVGLGTAAGGGFLINNSSWVVSQTGISSATIGAHLPVIQAALHVFGL